MSDLSLRFIPLIPTSKKDTTGDSTSSSSEDSSQSSSLLSGGSGDTVELSSTAKSESDDSTTGIVASNIDKSLTTISNSKATVSVNSLDTADSTDTSSATANTSSRSKSNANSADFNTAYAKFKQAEQIFSNSVTGSEISNAMGHLGECGSLLKNIVGNGSVTASDGTVVSKAMLEKTLATYGQRTENALNNWYSNNHPQGPSGDGILEMIAANSAMGAANSLKGAMFDSISRDTTSYIDNDEKDIANTQIDKMTLSDKDIQSAFEKLSDVNFDTNDTDFAGNAGSGTIGGNINNNNLNAGLGTNLSNTFSDASRLGTDIFNIQDSIYNGIGDTLGQDAENVAKGIGGGLSLTGSPISLALNAADSVSDAWRDNDTTGGFLGDTIGNFGDNIAQNIRDVGNIFGNDTIFSDVAGTVADGVSGIGHAIGSGVEWAVDGVSDFFGSMFGSSSSSSIGSGSSSSGGGGGGLGKWIHAFFSWF